MCLPSRQFVVENRQLQAGASHAFFLARQPEQLPYKFLFTQFLMRSSAFSMLSIELATLKRK